jgi:3-hydroxy-9,10-secoandrosta-1,3,5(10)-triene-9,17-dione monooxygenase
MSPAEAQELARGLLPSLRERAFVTEQARTLSVETLVELTSSGLLRLPNPDAYGGCGLEFDTSLEVARELGRACGSTAWCYSVWASHNWEIGLFPRAAQDEYFADGYDVLCCSGQNPRGGSATRVPGGYHLSGHWDFSSGIDGSTWAMVTAVTDDQGQVTFLVPRSDWSIVDNWYVSGLRGTGSKDIVVDGVFVPEGRWVSRQAMGRGETPGRELHDRASYRLPMFSFIGYCITFPLIGMAQGALEAFEERGRGQTAALTGQRLSGLLPLQLRLAESAAEVDAALSLARGAVRDMLAAGAACRHLPLEDRARFARDRAYAVRLCVRAVDRLFEASGAHSLYEASPLQRIHRDLHAGSHQVGVSWDPFAEQYGRIQFGLEPTSPFL